MILSKPVSIRPPPEPISPSVLGSNRETFSHPTGCAINGSLNSASSPSASRPPPPPLTPLFSWHGDEGESPHPNLIGASHHSQHSRRAFCNRLTFESHVVWTSMLSFTVYVPSNMFTWSACLEFTCNCLGLQGTLRRSFKFMYNYMGGN